MALEIISQAISARTIHKTLMINLSLPLTKKVIDRACHATEILLQHTADEDVMSTEEGQGPSLQTHNLFLPPYPVLLVTVIKGAHFLTLIYLEIFIRPRLQISLNYFSN